MTVIPFPSKRKSRQRRPRRPAMSWLRRHTGLATLALVVAIAVQVFDVGSEHATAKTDSVTVTRSFSLCDKPPHRDCVIDGDTFYLGERSIRIADIDTPEVFSPQCESERRRGEEATRRLQALLNAGPIEVARYQRESDRYGRALRIIKREGYSLGSALVSAGLARPWDGARRSWCA